MARLLTVLLALLFASGTTFAASPVLVELFTSEGCSSCPPADSLLQQLDRSQPVNGAPLIVLSEHVDYWNHIGWTDPYSSAFFTQRQNSYGDHFGLSSVYTPQMVVDGSAEFVGGDPRRTAREIQTAEAREKISVRLSSVAWDDPATLRAHVETGALPDSEKTRRAEVFVVAALDHAESQVARGENSGRRLTHVAVVLSLTKVGTIEKGKGFSGDVRVKLDPKRDLSQLRVIAFVQEAGPSRVLGADQQKISK